MTARTTSVWITLLATSLLIVGIPQADIGPVHSFHKPTPSRGHTSPSSRPPAYKPHKLAPGHGSKQRLRTPKASRSKKPRSVRKNGRRPRISSSRRSSTMAGSLRSLSRAAYPNSLHGRTEVDGRFLRPIDGDTFAMNGIKIRMSGLDAPELGAPGGWEAAQHLATMLREGLVTIVPRSRDVYGRTVADVFMNGQNLAERMIADGFARKA